MQRPQVGQVSNLYWKMGNFIARDVQLHEVGHLPDLLRQGDELVVVSHEALQIDEAADGSRKIGQLITAEIEKLNLKTVEEFCFFYEWFTSLDLNFQREAARCSMRWGVIILIRTLKTSQEPGLISHVPQSSCYKCKNNPLIYDGHSLFTPTSDDASRQKMCCSFVTTKHSLPLE